MGRNNSACTISAWTTADATILSTAGELYGLLTLGADASGTLTVYDSAVVKFVVNIATTQSNNIIFRTPISFTKSIVVDNTGTASYAVLFVKG